MYMKKNHYVSNINLLSFFAYVMYWMNEKFIWRRYHQICTVVTTNMDSYNTRTNLNNCILIYYYPKMWFISMSMSHISISKCFRSEEEKKYILLYIQHKISVIWKKKMTTNINNIEKNMSIMYKCSQTDLPDICFS